MLSHVLALTASFCVLFTVTELTKGNHTVVPTQGEKQESPGKEKASETCRQHYNYHRGVGCAWGEMGVAHNQCWWQQNDLRCPVETSKDFQGLTIGCLYSLPLLSCLILSDIWLTSPRFSFRSMPLPELSLYQDRQLRPHFASTPSFALITDPQEH